MKKTKIVVAMLLAVMMALTFTLAACKDNHEHTFAQDWTYDANQHWHKATCEHSDLTSGKANHSFNDEGKCTVCGYEKGSTTPEPDVDLLPYADNTVLRLGAGYNSPDTGIAFSDAKAKDGVKLSDGVTYHTGDLKPTWKFISDNMKINFTSVYTGQSASKEYQNWENQMDKVDVLAGTATQLQAGGAAGKLVNIADYLDKMPNFKAYLEANPIVRLSITGDTDTGAIYFSPYFDGVDDIERFPLIRSDFVKKLLDGDVAFQGANRALEAAKYEPYMPITGNVQVESLTKDGTGTQKITKDFSKNIIKQMNDALAKGELKGDAAVAMFRQYIDDVYGDVYENRSDLFLGYDACWDADELVALLRCGVASLKDENGQPMAGIFPRESNNNQRRVDIIRLAGHMFGVRGLESRQDYLYFGKDGKLHDARQDAEAYAAMERMYALTQEGLIATEVTNDKSESRLQNDQGMVSYDYNQTQTLLNNKLDKGEEYTVMMVPVARWNDGTGEQFFRFTESWRSVKTEGWAISKAGVGNDTNKLNAALALIDFAFSVQGQITMSYGPDSFIKVKDASVVVKTMEDVAKKYVTFDFNGEKWPVVSDGLLEDLNTLSGGNYTNHARQYLGSTLNGFPKSQAFEFQCTVEEGKVGGAKVSAAIGKGILKHPLLTVNTENMWYTSVPTTLPHDQGENNRLDSYTNLNNDHFGQSKDQTNVFLQIVCGGWTNVALESGVATPAAAAQSVAGDWGNGAQYLSIKNAAWTRLLEYYNSL